MYFDGIVSTVILTLVALHIYPVRPAMYDFEYYRLRTLSIGMWDVETDT